MKFVRIFLACALLPACAASLPEQPPGMPLDQEMMPGKPMEALTSVSTVR